MVVPSFHRWRSEEVAHDGMAKEEGGRRAKLRRVRRVDCLPKHLSSDNRYRVEFADAENIGVRP